MTGEQFANRRAIHPSGGVRQSGIRSRQQTRGTQQADSDP
jgi:hypothetical protein